MAGVFLMQVSQAATDYKLEFDKPATAWDNALPVGNGRLGAMVFGNVQDERIQLNEETVWAGQPIQVENPFSIDSLQKIRTLLFDGYYREAEDMANLYLLGNSPKVKTVSGRTGASYQTLGDLKISFKGQDGEVSDYYRYLDIANALTGVTYSVNDVKYSRQIFSSAVDQAVAARLTADKPGAISFTASLSRPHRGRNGASISSKDGQIIMTEHVGNGCGVVLYCRLQVLAEGGSTTDLPDGSVSVENADAVTLVLTAATDYRGEDPAAVSLAQLNGAASRSFSDMLKDHVADYRQYFDRVDLELGSGNTSGMTTDLRLKAAKEGNVDPDFLELYYQFARYLLISSSRPGTLAGNLQGIWADGLTPPWNADYHVNINMQMNYWPAGTAGLNEMSEPFVDFMKNMLPSARRTAREIYGMDGAMAHFATDAWFNTYPSGSPQWGMWPMGLAWCCQNIWDFYEYGGDKAYLDSVSYPIMKEAAIFCMEWLTENPKTGYLVSGRSISPENQFFVPSDGSKASVVMGPTMDHMIIRDLLQNTIKATKVLKVDRKLRRQMRKTLAHLQPTVIAEDGRILEWSEPLEEPEPGHRHISHLYGLYP
ncbi:MAG: glycoside hydrolase family 95 protein, partial [Bacteroidaceae bacterium]|nr:glycoside hydrolase family 95 protein [Bacteroidaceae bacterium]